MRIIEVLEGKLPDKKTLEHVKKCKECNEFYNYIRQLKREIENIEKLEPSPELEERIISSLKKEPLYLRIFALSLSCLSFIFLIFLPHSFKSFFPRAVLIFSQAFSLCRTLSQVFNFKVCYFILPLILIFILTNSGMLLTLFYIFKKLYREVRV